MLRDGAVQEFAVQAAPRGADALLGPGAHQLRGKCHTLAFFSVLRPVGAALCWAPIPSSDADVFLCAFVHGNVPHACYCQVSHFCAPRWQPTFSHLICPLVCFCALYVYVLPSLLRACASFQIQASEAISYLHNRRPMLIHRDIKSHNLLVTDDNKVELHMVFAFCRYSCHCHADQAV